ncbi:MAG: hypothetical protein EBY17_06305 [Acidobacteriia bacterium]|nr:hypothetical protein [Terriglobia bacterium]
MRRAIVIFLLLTATLAAANLKLYMADGGFQLVREYTIQEDRVRYYSVERSDWEEIPVALVDLKKTETEAQARKEVLEKQTKEVLEEETAVKQERQEIRKIPMDPGVYMLEPDEKGNDKLRIFKLGDWAMRNPKTRTLLKLVTPVPTSAISYMELPGEHSLNVMPDDHPEIYIQLSLEDSFGIVKLTPGKGIRQVERVTVEAVSKEVSEEREIVKVFSKQLTESGLFKIWPQQPLAKGEYAVIEYTEGKLDTRLWDFRIE